MMYGTALTAQEGLAMSKHCVTKTLTAIATVMAFGSIAFAGDNVTEDQILQALKPVAKPPLTRGLSAGSQADPAPSAAETKFVTTVRGRTTRSLSQSEREEIASIVK